jgi:nucleotide-binding universal stress UspA family protein
MKVLYATDGLPSAFEALRLLERVADRGRVQVTAISVTHAGVPAPEHFPLVLDPIDVRRAQTVEVVDAAVEALLTAGFDATGRTAEGDPAEEILAAIDQDWYDLTVVGAGSRGLLGRMLLGSVSTHVLHSSPSSVLMVHESAAQEQPRRVLLGADGSRGAELATRTLIDLVDSSRCEVNVISVLRDAPRLVPGPQAEEVDRLVAKARRNAEHLASMLQDGGITANADIRRGHPAERLLEEVRTRGADLVALGTRGLGRARHLVGSVSDQVARLAPATLVARRLVT